MAKADHSDKGEVLGVFEDRQKAEAAAERARNAGADDSSVRIGDKSDSRASLEAEMREEMEQAWLSPQAAFVATKEASKGLSLVTPIAVVAGALFALPFAFIFTFGGASLWLRLVIALSTGAVAGGTIGFILGGGLAIKGPDEPLAAERGVTVRVAEDRDEVVRAMDEEGPVRLDTVSPAGRRRSTVGTEEERTPDGVVEDLGEQVRRPEGDWTRTRQEGSGQSQ